jgi:GrpB-like predicted nucleotidyltransferase (UPF0157 family)
LRAHDEAAAGYEAEKRALAETFRHDRGVYTDAKDPIVWHLVRRADRWAQEIGWLPGPTDA